MDPLAAQCGYDWRHVAFVKAVKACGGPELAKPQAVLDILHKLGIRDLPLSRICTYLHRYRAHRAAAQGSLSGTHAQAAAPHHQQHKSAGGRRRRSGSDSSPLLTPSGSYNEASTGRCAAPSAAAPLVAEAAAAAPLLPALLAPAALQQEAPQDMMGRLALMEEMLLRERQHAQALEAQLQAIKALPLAPPELAALPPLPFTPVPAAGVPAGWPAALDPCGAPCGLDGAAPLAADPRAHVWLGSGCRPSPFRWSPAAPSPASPTAEDGPLPRELLLASQPRLAAMAEPALVCDASAAAAVVPPSAPAALFDPCDSAELMQMLSLRCPSVGDGAALGGGAEQHSALLPALDDLPGLGPCPSRLLVAAAADGAFPPLPTTYELEQLQLPSGCLF